MAFSNINFFTLSNSFLRYQVHARIVALIALTVYLISFLAEITWQLVPSAAPVVDVRSKITQRQQAPSFVAKLDRITAANLFGEAQTKNTAAVAVAVTDAPETNLNLNLSGTVFSNDPALGVAVIEHRGQQEHYQVGEKIDGTNVTLQRIFVDRVIIKNGRRDETLMLDGVDFARMTQPQAVIQSPQVKAAPSAETISAISSLRASPQSFTDYLSVSRVKDGIRVTPGKDASLFKMAGLKAGDIVTELNGSDLSDMSQLGQAMIAMRTATLLQMTIKRDDEYRNIELNLPESDK